MNLFALPWLELSLLVPLVGALCLSRAWDPKVAYRWCVAFSGLTLLLTFVTWLGQYLSLMPDAAERWELLPQLLGRPVLGVDELSAPLLPLVALLHFLTALATARTKMARFSFAWLLVADALAVATFGAIDPWLIIGLMTAGVIPPFMDLLQRGQPTRIYVLHMGLFVILLISGWGLVANGFVAENSWAILPLLAAILLRCGTLPVHSWITDLFEHGSFGTALLFVTPIRGVYAAVRLVLPIAPEWVLQILGVLSLATAVYAAGMAAVQRDARRFFAYLFLSHASLVLVGLELVTSISLTGALALWFSVALSLSGLGLTLRALEARFGHLSLTRFHGLYEHSPTLAVFFLLTGLASVGFPGTLGFVSAELLVDGAVEANLYMGCVVVLAAAINGIAIVRAYFLLFTGAQHVSSVSLQITVRERFAVLTLAAAILGGGLFPQPGIASRYSAAEAILKTRKVIHPEEPARQMHQTTD